MKKPKPRMMQSEKLTQKNVDGKRLIKFNGYVDDNNKIFRLNDDKVTFKAVLTPDDLVTNGVNFSCPLCKTYIAKRYIDNGVLLCKRCQIDLGIEDPDTYQMNDNFMLPNGTSVNIQTPAEKIYLEREEKQWAEQLNSYEDKCTLSRIMMLNLEIMRVQAGLSGNPNSLTRKELQNSLRMLSREVSELQKEISGRERKDTDAISIINRTIKECSDYRKNNSKLFEGVYKCDTCEKVVIVKSDFITFENGLLKELKPITMEAMKSMGDKFDFRTAETIVSGIIKYLSTMSPENYQKHMEKSVKKVFS